jgi:PAS domain S-box-containing protein
VTDEQISSVRAATALHTVIGDAPAAVLLVDLGAGEVVHANDVAQQLAPDLRLPVRVDAWSEAAGLRDPSGAELTDTEHPLSRLVRFEPVPGQPVSAQRRSEMGGSREPLWVVGVPMTGAPQLDGFALVVLLAVREQEATAAVEALAQEETRLRERAVLATGLSFTVADARDPDLALVWVNQAFTATTGYEFDEAVGHNCRFLQGPGTDPAEVTRMREALGRREGIIATLLNYRKDGLAFWNQVTMTPILDADGEVTHFVGVQSDVSGRIEADRERDRALKTAEEARVEAEAAQARLAVLADATEALTAELDESEARARLLQLLVPGLCDVAFFFHLDEEGGLREHFTEHRDPTQHDLADEYAAGVAAKVPAGGLVASLLADEPYRLLSDVDSAESRAAREEFLDDEAFPEQAHDALGITSVLIVGLPGREQVRDIVVLNRTSERAPFTEADAQLALDLGRRTGLILDNLRLYTGQSRIARTLQRSLLPAVPKLAWVDVDARYLAGADGAEVGGDFFDLFEHEDQSIALAVGDVEGHDMYAAAVMGQLKGILRATALTLRLMPAATLEHIDRLLIGTAGSQITPEINEDDAPAGGHGWADAYASARLASMVCAHLEPPLSLTAAIDATTADLGEVGGWAQASRGVSLQQTMTGSDSPRAVWTLTMSSAGHLPPLVRLPDGQLTFLDPPHARGPLLGLGTGARRRHDGTFALPAGSLLFMYTDGLIEQPGESLDVGLARLLEAAGSAPDDLNGFVDHLLAELSPASRPRARAGIDDVVVVALCLRGDTDES